MSVPIGARESEKSGGVTSTEQSVFVPPPSVCTSLFPARSVMNEFGDDIVPGVYVTTNVVRRGSSVSDGLSGMLMYSPSSDVSAAMLFEKSSVSTYEKRLLLTTCFIPLPNSFCAPVPKTA